MRLQAAAFAALTLSATACSRGGVEDRAFAWNEELPAGAIVHLRNGTGEINVRPASGQNFVVNGSRRWRHGRENDVKFVVTHTGNDYFVCAMWRNSGTCGAKGYRGKNTGGILAMFSLFHRSTDMTAGLPEAAKQKLTEMIPLARLGTAEDVAGAVLWLASDQASYVTGEVLRVNGGMYM